MADDREQYSPATHQRFYSDFRHTGDAPTHLYLIRHGQTQGNVRHQLIGHTDMPLDDLGITQARQVGRHMSSIRLDAIMSSPLSRARVTAAEVALHQRLDLELDRRLMEMNFGHAEGLTIAEAVARFPDLARLMADPLNLDVAWPGGDHRGRFHTQVMTTFTEIAALYQGRHVAVVCHGGVIGSLVAQLDGGSPHDYARYPVANCSITHLEVHVEGTRAHRLNDIGHLDVVLTEPFAFVTTGDKGS